MFMRSFWPLLVVAIEDSRTALQKESKKGKCSLTRLGGHAWMLVGLSKEDFLNGPYGTSHDL